MTVLTHEIKSQLAKLLATEDLVVEHKKVQTACFNVHTRVLTLPTWEKASGNVYDLLVAHEVGHALFTPDRDWTQERNIPLQFVNVVEDARVEKLMKRKYPGLPKTFYSGYRELNDKDFFALEDENVEEFNLADRANLHFKIGSFLPLSFKEDEQVIVDQIAAAETFDEVLDAAEVLYKYCKEDKCKVPEMDNLETDNQMSGSGNLPMDSGEQEDGESENGEKQETEGSTEGTTNSSPSEHVSNTDDDISVQTDESFSQNLQELTDNRAEESTYLEVPSVNLDTIVVSNKDLHEYCNDFYNMMIRDCGASYEESDKLLESFKRSAQKEVNYLVKEFECKKSASQYARSTVSRTGVLDTAKLHTYKFNEDLFKKVSVIPDGKNHGLIFVCDWSGSMGPVMLDTIKQMFQLVWFCKKVQIPFDVYAFTTEWWCVQHTKEDGTPMFPVSHYQKRENLLHVHPNFSMLNILTSNTNNRELDNQIKNLWRVGVYYSKNYGNPIPSVLELCGTPLNEAIVSLFEIIPDFKKRTHAEKVNVVVLSDGESNCAQRHREVKRSWESEPYIGVGHIPYGSYLRDRKVGTTYSIINSNENENVAMTVTLLRNLSDRFPQENLIGIRVCESRDFNHHLRRYIGWRNHSLEATLIKEWKKEKAVAIPNSGYKKYFTLSSTSLSQESEFKVEDDASKAQIKNAFKKSLNAKKTNKKILSQFIELVA